MRTTTRKAVATGAILLLTLVITGIVAAAAQAATLLAMFGPSVGGQGISAISTGKFSGFAAPVSSSPSAATIAITVVAGVALLGLIAYVAFALDRRSRPGLRLVGGTDVEAGESRPMESGESRPAEDEEQRRRAA